VESQGEAGGKTSKAAWRASTTMETTLQTWPAGRS